QPTILEIFDKTRLIDRLNWAKSHGNRRELPEIRHQPGMRIRREPSARLQFASEVFQFLARNAAFQIRAGVHARSSMALKINDVTIAALDRKSTRLNSSHVAISYAVFCLKKKK